MVITAAKRGPRGSISADGREEAAAREGTPRWEEAAGWGEAGLATVLAEDVKDMGDRSGGGVGMREKEEAVTAGRRQGLADSTFSGRVDPSRPLSELTWG